MDAGARAVHQEGGANAVGASASAAACAESVVEVGTAADIKRSEYVEMIAKKRSTVFK